MSRPVFSLFCSLELRDADLTSRSSFSTHVYSGIFLYNYNKKLFSHRTSITKCAISFYTQLSRWHIANSLLMITRMITYRAYVWKTYIYISALYTRVAQCYRLYSRGRANFEKRFSIFSFLSRERVRETLLSAIIAG